MPSGRRKVTTDPVPPDAGTSLPDELRRVADGPVPRSFERHTVTIGAGDELAYIDHDWRDTLIVVSSGEVEVVCAAGGRRRFSSGDMLWFDGLDVRTLRNVGGDQLVIAGVRRRT